jgi:putative tryptophan/tyrosine transport system substrate-binding protein
MRRRAFITLLGGAAVWPLAARAQQPAMPVIGVLNSETSESRAERIAAFRQGLKESGFVEGQNVVIEFAWARGQYDRLPDLAADLVRRHAAVIVAIALPSALAAKATTSTTPIVFASGGDPVQVGLVDSLNRPGGNVTGVSLFNVALGGKRLGLLLELVPAASTIAVLENPNNPRSDFDTTELQMAVRAVGKQILIAKAADEHGLDRAFATLVQGGAGALLIPAEPLFISRRERLVRLAARYAVPAIYEIREFVAAGGLMSYGINAPDAYRQVGLYTGRVLKGVKPADLPVQQPTKFELVINLKTAKALGITVPPGLLAIADEVIE